MNPDQISDLHWNLTNTYHTTNIEQIDPQTACVSTHYIDVNTLSYAKGARCGNWCGRTLHTDTITLQSNIKPVVCFTIHNNKHKI